MNAVLEAYNEIESYCRRRGVSAIVRSLVVSKFVEALKAATVANSRKLGRDLRRNEKSLIISTLSSEEALNGYIADVEQTVCELKGRERMVITQEQGKRGFLYNVWANIVGATVFAILMVLLYLFVVSRSPDFMSVLRELLR